MIAFPNAKINIGLNITGRRPDGYHNLETVLYPVKIYDALEIITADKVSFNASGTNIPGRVADNLCLKGYELLKKDFPLPAVNIHLHKHIPIGAGLGGGSADAAFCIKLLNQKFTLGLTGNQMRTYARQLGADCAFFIEAQPVYAFNKGDEFEQIQLNLSAYDIALVMPPVYVSTAEAYRGVKPRPSATLLKETVKLPITSWKQFIINDFEETIFKNYPLIKDVKAALYEEGALYASMSGSGASVFGIFDYKPNLTVLEKTNQVFYLKGN